MQRHLTTSAQAVDVLDNAARFLVDGQSTDGLWRDFRTLAGAGSEWVTGFVCQQVAGCGRLDEEVAKALHTLSYRQKPTGGWS
ncbi:MAG: hypothetical protein AAFW60_07990, partial [Pseudomonadota bacterium]